MRTISQAQGGLPGSVAIVLIKRWFPQAVTLNHKAHSAAERERHEKEAIDLCHWGDFFFSGHDRRGQGT